MNTPELGYFVNSSLMGRVDAAITIARIEKLITLRRYIDQGLEIHAGSEAECIAHLTHLYEELQAVPGGSPKQEQL